MSEGTDSFEGGESPCLDGKVEAPGAPGPEEPAGRGAEKPERGDEAESDESGRAGITAEEIQEMMGQLPPELLAPDLPVVLASMAMGLEEQAWRHLGLVTNPVTHAVEKDLQKAKIAIDVVAFIVTQVSPLVSDIQRRDLQNKVSTLQMNFVQQSRNG